MKVPAGGRTLTLATEGPIGFRVFVTHAKHEAAVRFYERKGMIRLAEAHWPCRMVSAEAILACPTSIDAPWRDVPHLPFDARMTSTELFL